MKKLLILTFLPVSILVIFHLFTPEVHAQISPGAVFDASKYSAKTPISEAVAVPKPADGNIANLQRLLTTTYICTEETPDQGFVMVRGSNQLISLGTKYYTCTRETYRALLANGVIPAPSTLSSFESTIIWMMLWTLSTIANFFIFILRNSASLLVQMIGQGSFIQNELVKQAWPFVQGIANLGFIFALLYIALATTLRLESVTASIQRLLPKLLFGALLVNFSLVIGGVCIDASRLVMAVETSFLGQGEVTYKNLGVKLIEQSGIYESVFTKSTGVFFNQEGEGVSVGRYNSWSLVLEGIQSTMFIIFLAAGMVVIALGLFWRYIMLLILLIASPLAYFAIALPKTAPYFSEWWKQFIKWVTYGPIMLFILILITRVQAASIVQPISSGGSAADNITDTANTPMYQSLVKLIVVVALMMLAAKFSKGSSGMFADAFMGFMKKTGNAAMRNPKTALIIGSGGAALPVALGLGAAQMAGRGLRNVGRDFSNTAVSNLKESKNIKWARKKLGYGIRDAQGKLKTGKSTMASSFAGALTDKYNVSMQEDIQAIKALKAIDEKNVNDTALVPSQLKKGHVTEALGQANIDAIIKHGNQAQRMELASNADYIASLKPEDMKKLQQTILSAPYQDADKKKGIKAKGVSEADKTKTLQRISQTVLELKK